jgi:hypothetical protein
MWRIFNESRSGLNTVDATQTTGAFEQLCELRKALLRLHAVAKAARNDAERGRYS